MSNSLMKVPIARTGLTESEIQSVLEPLRSGWLVQGPKVREFEQAWCTFTGAEHSIAVTSCGGRILARAKHALATVCIQPGRIQPTL